VAKNAAAAAPASPAGGVKGKGASKAGPKASSGAARPGSRAAAGAVSVRGLTAAVAVAGLAAVVLLPMTLVCVVLLIPTLVAAIVDRDTEKFAPITVGAMNLAGVAPAVAELWSRGATLSRALEILADPFMWLFALGSAGIGWGLHILVPSIVAAIMSWRLERRRTLLEDGRKILSEEWGQAVEALEQEATAPAPAPDPRRR